MKDYPVIKLAVLFVIGIFTAKLFQINFIIVVLLFVSALIIFLLSKKIKSNLYFTFTGILLVGTLVVLSGNYLASENKLEFDEFASKIDKVKNATISGEITKIDLVKDNELIFYLETDSMSTSEFLLVDKLNILCKLKLGKKAILSLDEKLKPGNKLVLKGFYYRGKQKRNPAEFDYDAYLKSKGILGILSITDEKSINVIKSDLNYFQNTIHQIRKAIDKQLKKYHNQETAALLRGLILADRGEINYETKTQFINAGVVHVLAVSGLHVGFIVMIFLFLFGRFNLVLRSVLTIIGLLCFMLITGVPPSVFRAVVMSIVLVIAFLSNRSTNLVNSISIAAVIILILDPNEIYNPGFQLSFAAVLAIALFLPIMNGLIYNLNLRNKFLKYCALFCGVSLSAQIGTLPFTLLYFNKFSIIALLTNFLVIPSIGIIIAAAIGTVFFSVLLPFVAVYLAAANNLFSGFIIEIIKYSGELSFSHINLTDYTLVDLIVFYLFSGAFLYLIPKFESKKSKIILLTIITANIYMYSVIDDSEVLPENMLSLLMIDVGQGDSFLVKFPNGETALIDAGNTTVAFDTGERVLIPLLEYLGIRKVNYGIISHIDADHYGGFVSLILDNRIGEIFKPELDTSLSKDIRFEKLLKDKKVPVRYFKEEKIVIGNSALYFFYDNKVKELAGMSTNDRSAMFKLIYGETSILFTGDMGKKMEKIYSNKYKSFIDSDILKVAHHGSKTSSAKEFIEKVTPEISLISAGFKNKFGHPEKEIIDILKEYGSTIYRTDLQKATILVSDGREIRLMNWE